MDCGRSDGPSFGNGRQCMKILGINWGRKNGQNHGNLEKVLAAAAAAGAETKLIDTIRLYFAPIQPEHPDMDIQDDFQSLLDEILTCDGLVVSCPVYALTPVGQYKSFVDRPDGKIPCGIRSPLGKSAPGTEVHLLYLPGWGKGPSLGISVSAYDENAGRCAGLSGDRRDGCPRPPCGP